MLRTDDNRTEEAYATNYQNQPSVAVFFCGSIINKMATHNHVFSLSGDVIRNKAVGLYIVGRLSKLPQLFSYNNMATWNKLKTLTISLPVTANGEPDFDYMEKYIQAIEKVVIADVVKYKDKVIETTKKIVG